MVILDSNAYIYNIYIYIVWEIMTYITSYTLWLLNIAMENGPFIDDLQIN